MFDRLPTKFAGAFLIKSRAFGDERGFFKETYVRSKYVALGITDNFVQDNVSFSRRGVLRGLHADPQMAKLVQVLRGEVFDVIVDTRKDSPTFGRWEGFRLHADDHVQLYIPAGFLHGFLVLTDDAVFTYKQTAEYAPERQIGVRWNDPYLGIKWPLSAAPVVSSSDAAHPLFLDVFRIN